jgi:hypothetical protein
MLDLARNAARTTAWSTKYSAADSINSSIVEKNWDRPTLYALDRLSTNQRRKAIKPVVMVFCPNASA